MATSTSDTGSPFNRGTQHEAKHGAILSRASKLFNTKGARATTLSDVADKLGLTKTSLYYYVKTKEDLIYQCYDASMRHAHLKLDRIENQTADPLERVILFMREQVETIQRALKGEDDYFAAPLELASLKNEHQQVLREEYLRMFRRVRQYIRDGMANGSIRESHSTSTTRALIGALDWSFYWLYEMSDAESANAADGVADMCLNGMLAPGFDYSPASHPLTPESAAPAKGFDREAQNRLKQEAFFKAGTRFFNRKGFSGTSLDEIAEHLQVSKGAFYYHFTNKESLLTQCYEYSLDQFEAILAEVGENERPSIGKLDEVCRRVFNVQNSDLGPLVRYNTITALPPPIRRKVLGRTEAIVDRLGDFLRAGCADGSCRAVDVPVAKNMLQGAINASMDIEEWRRMEDTDEAAQQYFDVFFFGLSAKRS